MFDFKFYTKVNESEWNKFVSNGKNSHFMFNRSYIDYHSDRFEDCSIMVFLHESDDLIACIPASAHEGEIRSHGGLTFGSIISHEIFNIEFYFQFILDLLKFLKLQGFKTFLFKPIPSFYNNTDNLAMEYLLFRCNAKLLAKSISSFIGAGSIFPSKKGTGARKCKSLGYRIDRTGNIAELTNLIDRNLLIRHGVNCVHSAAEMEYLAGILNDNISCFFVRNPSGVLVGGAIVYLYRDIAHTQYITVSPEVRKDRVLDLIMFQLYEEYVDTGKALDFGISTTDNGRNFNFGLFKQKQEYGAYPVCYDQYLIDINAGIEQISDNA